MATLDAVLAAIDAQPATATTCVQAVCECGSMTLILSDAAPPTDGTYRYDLTAFMSDGPTMSEFTDDRAGIDAFFSLFVSGPEVYVEGWEIETVRHYCNYPVATREGNAR